MQAEQGIQKLKEKVDTLIVIPNDRLLTVSNEKTSVLNAFKMADEVLLQGVQGITDLITTPGLINTDFADVKMIMSDAGSALMGIGYGVAATAGRSPRRAPAISSPLLEASIEGARGILLNISGGSDLGLFEVNEAAEVIHGVAHPDANIIFGAVIDDEMGDEVRVTVIAAGFDRWDGQRRARACRPCSAVADERVADLFAADDDDLDGQRRRLRRPVVPEVAVARPARPRAEGGRPQRPHRRHLCRGRRLGDQPRPGRPRRPPACRGRPALDVDAPGARRHGRPGRRARRGTPVSTPTRR